MMIYVAGPYTTDPEANVARAMDVGDAISDAGHVPEIPHLSHYRHARRPRDYEHWMREDLAKLARCDALVRLPGESPGADPEVAFAESLGIVVYTLEDLTREVLR